MILMSLALSMSWLSRQPWVTRIQSAADCGRRSGAERGEGYMPSGVAERAQTSTIAPLGPMQAAVRLHSLCRTFTSATHSRKLLPLLSRVSVGLHTPPRPQTFGFEHAKPRIGLLVPLSRTMAAAVSRAAAQPSFGGASGSAHAQCTCSMTVR